MITVIAVDGALGEIIVDILNANNVDAVFASSPAVHITNKIVFVTFEFDGYPFVMTKRWLAYNEEAFNDWKQHWLGRIEINDRADVTPEEWKHHVTKSLKHVGVYYPINGMLQKLIDENSAHDLTYCEIELDTLLHRRRDVLRDLSSFTNANIVFDSIDDVVDSTQSDVLPWI
jgi:hypothetical protein